MSTLLGLCGSLRAASLNRKLMREAARLYGGPFEEGNLRFPLYDGDLEEAEGIPAEVQALADQIKAAPAVLVATPEYNKGISGVLKNALDWVSRTQGAPWDQKPVAILSATAGRAGGERAQYALRLSLHPFRADVLQGPEVLVGAAQGEFDEDGRLQNARNLSDLETLMGMLRAKATADSGFR
ncbi:MAG: NAD(P)H-dependent oxidoreductase [Pseudomonadota bacterium]